MNPQKLAEGAIVDGRYRLERRLGEGGMGAVWSAQHTLTGRRVALKFIKAGGNDEAELCGRLLREARAASLVSHPNVIEVHDVFELDPRTPVMVMDLLEGESLRARLDREVTLSVEQAAELLLPIVSAVGTAHALGVIHRDLKPDNIFLTEGATGDQARVLDFGIAKLVGHDEENGDLKTVSGIMLGTLAYMAPEQALAEPDVDSRVDVWALGVILYECLAGVLPIDAPNIGVYLQRMLTEEIVPLRSRRAGLPEEVCDLVDRMLRRDRDRRVPDLRQVAEVLARHTSVRAPAFGAPPKRAREEQAVVSTSRSARISGRHRRATGGATMRSRDTSSEHERATPWGPRSWLLLCAALVLAALSIGASAPNTVGDAAARQKMMFASTFQMPRPMATSPRVP